MPDRFGSCQTVKRHDDRWVESHLIDGLFEELDQGDDLEWLMLDSTVIRAHQ